MLNITPYIYYRACFNILLSKFSGKQDIVVGMPVSGRSGRFLNTVGMFVNTVVLRNQPSENKKITDFFADVRTNSVAVLEHQKYPYDELVRKLNVEVGKRNPLFDVMFAYQSDELTDIVFGDNKAELIPIPVSSAKCDFSFSIMPRCEDIVIMVEYCTALYRENRIKQFINAYRLILEQCLDEQMMIKNINVTTEEEKSAVSKFNDTFVDYNVADSDSLFSFFYDNARKNFEKTCIRMSDKSVNYGHLLYFSECLDGHIRSITGNKKSVIAVIAERSVEMYAGIYGILRGGNAESFANLVQEYRNNDYGSVVFVNYLHSDDECQVAAAEIKELAEDYELYFYPHCVGSAVAYKIIGFMENDYNMRPECFIVGASLPMSKVIRKNPWDFCPDSFIAWVLKSAGAQFDSTADKKLRSVIESFRKDTGYATEVFSRSNTVLSCPVTVVINKNDVFTKNYKNAKKLWSRYSENRVSVEFIESGSHYFQSDNAEELFDIIKKLSD